MSIKNESPQSHYCVFHLKIRILSVVLILLAYPLNALSENMPDKLNLLGQLADEKFDELDATLNNYQEEFQKRQLSDRIVEHAFDSFSNSDPMMEVKLSRWVSALPDSYAARLARGTYYVHMGFLSRGLKYRKDTTHDQIQKMKSYFSLAATDLNQSLEINPRLTVAIRELMRVAMAAGGPNSTRELFTKGLQIEPGSYVVWNGYLYSLQPKWGGSIAEMEAAIKQMKLQYKQKPELKALAGYVAYTQGNVANIQGKKADAMKSLTKALRHGPHPWFLKERGRLHYRLKKYDAAFADFDRALNLQPQDSSALRWRAKVYRVRAQVDMALTDFDLAVKLDRLDPGALSERGELLEALGKKDLALTDYNDALVYGSNSASNWFNRGALYLNVFKDYKKAIPDLKNTVELDPGEQYYWYRYGLAHYYAHDCDITHSLGTYVNLCKNAKCKGDQLNWAKYALSDLKNKGICQ